MKEVNSVMNLRLGETVELRSKFNTEVVAIGHVKSLKTLPVEAGSKVMVTIDFVNLGSKLFTFTFPEA